MKILMLHDVRQFDPDFFPDRYMQHSFLTEDAFVRGLDIIGREISSARDQIESRFTDSPSNYLLTFDDGLRDHLKVAEILADKKLSAIFFIPFGILEKKCFIASHLIQFLNASGKRLEISYHIKKHLKQHGVLEHVIDSYRVSRWANNLWTAEEVFITRALRESLNSNMRADLINELTEIYLNIDLGVLHQDFYLDLEDINKIKNMGHVIGSHGYYSHDLRFESPNIVREELLLSFEKLCAYERETKIISYANGGVTSAVLETAKSAGYAMGFGTQHRCLVSEDETLHLPRLDGTKLNIFR